MPLVTGTITRAATPNLHEPGIRKLIFNEFDLWLDEYQHLYEMDTSRKAQEHDLVMSGMSVFSLLDENDEVTFDTIQEAYKATLTHLCFGKGIQFSRIARQDDLYGFLKRGPKELGKTAKYTKNVKAMDPLNNSTTTTIYTLNSLARPLLSTTHQRVDGGTWSNRFSVSTSLGVETVELALTAFRKDMVDHRGRPQMVKPKYLNVSPTNEFIARRLLETNRGRPFSNANDVNVLLNYDLELKVLTHLTDSGSHWYLTAAAGETGGRYFDREMFNVVSDRDARTQADLFMAFYRESHGYIHPMGVYGSPP
jgi:hypothetical protein